MKNILDKNVKSERNCKEEISNRDDYCMSKVKRLKEEISNWVEKWKGLENKCEEK